MSGASRLLREALAARLARREGRALASRPRGSITSDPNGTPLQGLDTTPSVSDPVEMRMARARRLGFDTETPLYHGTGRNFDAFDTAAPETTLGSGNNDAIYLTNRTDHADAYAGSVSDNLLAYRQNIDADWAPRVLPLVTRDTSPLVVSDDVYAWLKQNEAARSGRARMNRYVDERGRRAWEQLFPGEPMPEGSLLQAIRDRGYSSLRTTSDEEVAVFDPSNIRSRFAAFDPARSNSSDLLAGLAIGVPAGGLTLREVLRDQYGERA